MSALNMVFISLLFCRQGAAALSFFFHPTKTREREDDGGYGLRRGGLREKVVRPDRAATASRARCGGLLADGIAAGHKEESTGRV
jgi:hypothetical protein